MDKIGRFTIFLLISLLLLSACATADSPPDEEKAFDPNTTKIGYAVQTLGNPVFTTIVNGGRDAALEHGADPDNFIVFAAENDLPTQVSQVEDAIQQGIDLFVLHPVDIHGLLDVTARAIESGMVIVNAGELMEGTGAISRVIFTEWENGTKVGEYVSDMLGEEGGCVVLLDGIVGEFTAVTRAEAFLEVLSKNPNIELVARQPADYDRGKGLAAMENILQAQDCIDVVYAVNDEMALGAAQAIRAVGREDDIKIIGTDGGDEAIQAVADGVLNATLLLPMADMGYLAVDTGIRYMMGETVPDTVEIPTYLINIENVDQVDDLLGR